jgi:branched-chain amino acid transport system permease protein
MKNVFTRHPRLFGLLIGLIIYALIPVFIQSPYYLDLFINVIVNAILGMMFIMTVRTGLINMGIIPFWGIGAYASAIYSVKMGMSVWLAMPMATLTAAVIALILGIILIGSGSGGFSFVMLSAVIGMLFNVVVGNISYLGAWDGIPNIPAPSPIDLPFLPTIEFTSKASFLYLALFILAIIILVINAFYKSWAGRAWDAIGMSPRLAESLGINIFRYKLLAFTVSCAMCGFIGSFYAHYQGFLVPDSFGMWQNIYVQIYAILGGIGYATLGPLVGSAVMTFFPEFIRIAKEIAPILTGLILIALILFLPEGLLGLGKYRSNFSRLVKWYRSSTPGARRGMYDT